MPRGKIITRLVAIVAFVAFASGCDNPDQSKAGQNAAASIPKGRLQQLVASNATVIGYLYTPDKPYVIASFNEGTLQWRSDPKSPPLAQGAVDYFTEPDKTCVGFQYKNVSMPSRGPERYMVCEATRPIQHSNSLPRSQDFYLDAGTMFMEYEPPAGTGFIQYYYAAISK